MSHIDFQEADGVPHCLLKHQQSPKLPSKAIKKQVQSGQKSQTAYRESRQSKADSLKEFPDIIRLNIIYIMRINGPVGDGPFPLRI